MVDIAKMVISGASEPLKKYLGCYEKDVQLNHRSLSR
jgi:hypothetical protein